ncbi:sigma 54-interacting transcriptional regulator [Methylomarinum vadi]|uniref:sigma 54-interacting transcriptional regulator n=1 Tax=Methylomarinum vadi TaxID=438855 RepID=UPI0009FCA0C4|nr:sigma 54-interacting transcriptional regulator [Methylomarinum vadi]
MPTPEQVLRRHELILNAAGEGIYGLDKEGKATFANPAAIALTGWNETDVIGKPVHELHHHTKRNGEPYPHHECPIYATLNDGEVHHVTDEIFWHKNGGFFPVHYTSTPIWENGAIIGAVVIFQDVSKLNRAEAAVIRLQRQNELLLTAAGEGICGFDCEGNVTFINPTAAALLAWPDRELRGHTIHDIFGRDEPRAEEYCPVHNIINGKRRFEVSDKRFWRHDGSSFPVDFVSTPVLENDRLQGVVVVFRDISERKLAEEKLKTALAEIKQLKNRLQAENTYLQEQINLNHHFGDILGQSPALQSALRQVEQVAPTDTTVLILGETGTGKELFARALHTLSRRKDRPLVKVNCAALPANLIESELFGHEKGSFTGATARRIGRFELAHEGTIFLDEIGELPLELQAKLLRVLQEGEIERLGDAKTRNIDVRVLAATHRDLKQMAAEGRFREDLFYRLSVFPLALPPLRERKHDISLLAQCFLAKYAQKTGKTVTHIPQAAMTQLQNYPWPGNVRELENVIERAVILSSTDTLQIPKLHQANVPEKTPAECLQPLAAMEKAHIIKVLEHTGWRISGEHGAAAILEMHPNTLRSRMSKLGIRRALEAK